MMHEGVFPGFGGGASVFADRPHATTVKAMLINTAYRYPLSSESGTDFTRFTQGWGLPDIAALYAVRDNIFIVNETDLLLDFGGPEYNTKSYNFVVASGDPALRVTLVYADPPGNPTSGVTTVNDLTLRVTSLGGVACYFGNHGLLSGNWSTASQNCNLETSPDADHVNTVENVFVSNPQPGTWTITVFADLVAQDGHVETPAEPNCAGVEPPFCDADYALVISSAPRPRGRCCHGTECLPTGLVRCSYEAPEDCDDPWDDWNSEATCADECFWCPLGPVP